MNFTSPHSHGARTRTTAIRVFSAALLIGGLGLVTAAPASANDKVCPDGGDWVKYNGLSGLSFTMPPADIDEGYEVTENCMKVGSHDPVYGTGTTVTNDDLFNPNENSLQDISHASFKIEKIPPPPQPEDQVVVVTLDGEWKCDDTTVTTTTTTTTTPYVLVDGVWGLADEPSSVVVDQGTRDLTDDEFEACETNGETTTTQPPVDEQQLSPVAPGPVSPPATQTPAPEAPEAEALTPQAPTPAPAADPTQALLPSTGSTSGFLAAVAGLLMLAGFGLRRFGPQRIEQLG